MPIVPPTSAKRARYGFLREVRKKEAIAIAEADEVYVLGWSMPETDKDQECLIRSAVAERSERIQRVTIVNRGAPPEYFRRVAQAFDAEIGRLQVFNAGFAEFAAGL